MLLRISIAQFCPLDTNKQAEDIAPMWNEEGLLFAIGWPCELERHALWMPDG